MQFGEILSRHTAKVSIADWKCLFSLLLGPGFTSTSPLRDTGRLEKSTNGIDKMMEENKIETRNWLLFLIHYPWTRIRHWTMSKIRIFYWQKLRRCCISYFFSLKWQNYWLWIYSQYSYCWKVLLPHNIEKY